MYFSRISSDRLVKYAGLFSCCFPSAKALRSTEYLKWLYAENPDGEAFGFDAFDGDRLAAHYACIPVNVRLRGRHVNAMLSLNTATHPDYQGQGLFTRLAAMTYEHAADNNINVVYGIANSNSTSGFTEKLGFQLVSPLDSWIGLGHLGVRDSWEHIYEKAEFMRLWTKDSIAWRISCPANPVFFNSSKNGSAFSASTGRLFINVYSETEKMNPEINEGAGRYCSPSLAGLRVFLGLFPKDTLRKRFYLPIPEIVKPSPLNLVYKNLREKNDRLSADSIFLGFLDFDAF